MEVRYCACRDDTRDCNDLGKLYQPQRKNKIKREDGMVIEN